MSTSMFLIFTQFFIPPNCAPTECQHAIDLNIDFSIHGLWPEYNNNSYPSYCNSSADFDVTKLKPIMNDLNNYWVSYVGSNQNFWKHEYMKHATCYPGIDEFDFFDETMKLYLYTNTSDFFKNNFHYNTSYDLGQLENAFDGKFHCGNGTYHQINSNTEPSSQIVQYWQCYDLALNRIECPEWLDTGSCNQEVYFKAF